MHQARIRGLRALPLVICGVAAWMVCQLPWAHENRLLVPYVFAALIVLGGFYWGRGLSMLACVVSAGVFACTLYPPFNSLVVSNPAARSALGWMVLAGVSLSFLLLPPGPSPHHK